MSDDENAIKALRETVAAYADQPDEWRVLTNESYSGPDGRWWTGVTIGDLRAVVAELALKDQALDEIKHALESGTWPGYGLTVERIERILTRLDTQGETK